MDETGNAISSYVKHNLQCDDTFRDSKKRELILTRVEKAFSFLPEDVLDLFLSGFRPLAMVIVPDTGLPLGMSTRSEGPASDRKYTVVLYPEHHEWAEDRFIGGFLRELAHVVAQRPPEDEWPHSRGDRARYKEQLECRADTMVWRWGLRHYCMAYLAATYPQHWVERIVDQIGKMLLDQD